MTIQVYQSADGTTRCKACGLLPDQCSCGTSPVDELLAAAIAVNEWLLKLEPIDAGEEPEWPADHDRLQAAIAKFTA